MTALPPPQPQHAAVRSEPIAPAPPQQTQPQFHTPAPTPAPTQPQFAPPPAPHATLPIPVAIGAIVVLTASLIVSKLLLDALVGLEWPVAVYVALLTGVGYGPSMAWCLYASKRWGSGSLARDAGLTPRWSDLGWAPVIWLSTLGVQAAVIGIILAVDIPISSNTDGVTELQADRTYVVAIVIAAVIAAPLVEEIVFRGVVMRALLSRVAVVPTIAIQGFLFGAAHVDPVRGVGNIGLVIVLTAVGCSFGAAAYWLRRIGPTILAHAIYNGVVLTVILSGLADRLDS
ncbi:MAG: CPBP family intramembrane glutamic endopeptidase [Actinomycetota bacterium]